MLKYATTILLLAWPAYALAQQPDPPRTEFADQLDVRLVHVDVRVERRGKPVTDLGVEDFLLLEDGEPVEIAVFSPPEPAGANRDSAGQAGETGAKAPADTAAASATEAPADDLPTVAVFVDDVGLGPGQRRRAVQTIEALSDPANPNSDNLVVFRHFRRGRLTLQRAVDAAFDPADFRELNKAVAVREQQGVFFAMREIQSSLAHSSCIDARGISAPSQANAALDSPRFGGSQLNQMITDANLQSGLTQLATETGGSTIFNANNVVKPVLRSLEEAEAVYTLAFYPQHERTGERHVLEVRLVGDARRRTRLSYRRSYMDRTMQQEWADGLRTAARAPELRPESSLPNPLGAQLAVTADADGLVAILSLDADAVATLMSLSNQSERRLRLWLYVVDPEGRETAAREGFLPAPVDPGPWQANIRLALPAGEWTVAAGLRDEVTGEISLLRDTPPNAPSL